MIPQATFDRHHSPSLGFDLTAIYTEYYGGKPQTDEALMYLDGVSTIFPIRSRQVAASMLIWARVLETRPAP